LLGHTNAAHSQPTGGASFRRLVSAALLLLWSGCSLQPLQQQTFPRFLDPKSKNQAITADAIGETGTPVPPADTGLLRYGKIVLVQARRDMAGVVIGAPHGTFDAHTAEFGGRLCAETGLAGVFATGFTPAETGDRWRINVNRPSELHVVLTLAEIRTSRAQKIFEWFKKSVLRAAAGKLDLYVEIHQNNGARIEVATVGLSPGEARLIKEKFRSIRDRTLAQRDEIAVVDLAIEPIDELEVGAWPAKTDGILTLAAKSLHFELPADGVMGSELHRIVYALILARLFDEIIVPLTS
jgi:hypothetical protein